jgi:hypothetical protein
MTEAEHITNIPLATIMREGGLTRPQASLLKRVAKQEALGKKGRRLVPADFDGRTLWSLFRRELIGPYHYDTIWLLNSARKLFGLPAEQPRTPEEIEEFVNILAEHDNA